MTPWGLGLLALLAVGPAGVMDARAQEIRFRDLRDREVVLAKPAERVVALPAPAAPTLIAVDQSARRVIGMHPTVKEIAKARLIGRIFAETTRIESALLSAGGAAFTPNVEAIAALRPDLVIQRGELGMAVVDPLTSAGLRTALVAYGGEDLTRRNIQMFADLAGKPERGRTLIAWRDAVLAMLPGEPAADAPKTLFLSRFGGHLAATGTGTPNDFAIAAAGGRNLADRPGSISVSSEQLMVWNPDVLLLSSMDRNLSPEEIYADPILSATTAARNRRVYKVPLGMFRWEPPNPENPLFWLWLATLLPNDAPSYDLRTEIRKGFELIYAYAANEDELDEMLAIGPNKRSRHYDRVLRR